MKVDFILYLNCFFGGMLGFAIQILNNLIKERKRAKTANVVFSFKEYFSENFLALLLNFICIIAIVWLLDLIVGYNPSLLRFIKFFFIAVGFMGSSVLVSLLGNYADKIQKVVDVKTDIADGVGMKTQ